MNTVTRMTARDIDRCRLKPEEVTELARKVVTNVTYLDLSVDHDTQIRWIILGFLSFTKAAAERVAGFYEDWHKAGPMAVNGSPMFFSIHFLHRDNVEMLLSELKRLDKALGTPANV
jgi:hypothetical protein